ncbi:MAG TPA: (Fe-S)-binding protein [Syntrophorhabdales bacterium]|nr:(Fe-S)-binding protein [Syntrophorhabdales bacterium]
MGIGNLIFALLFLAALVLFVRRVYLLFAMVLLGQGENRLDRLKARLQSLMVYGFGQRRVVQKAFGVNHLLLFWGFIVLQLFVNIEFIARGFFPSFTLTFIGRTPYRFMMTSADITSGIVLIVALIAIIRRAAFRPWYIEGKAGAYVILILVALLMVGDLGIHAASIAMGAEAGALFPVSRLLAGPLLSLSSGTSTAILLSIFWWLHGLVLIGFICYIPYSKHLHILTALINCFFRRLSFPNTLSRLAFLKGGVFGVSTVIQLTWKDLLDLFSCTECGRCASVCPATATGKVLNPMEVILEGKENLETNGMGILRQRSFDSLERADEKTAVTLPLIGESGKGQIRPEAAWDCTTCGACVEKCPVFIEQFPKLLKVRRHLVMEEVDFPPELVTLFENVEQRSNPYGIAPSERDKWAGPLDIPLISKEYPTDYLLFVGCVPSFNPRMRSVLAAISEILKMGGVSFAILGKQEPCCGDPLRRTGNEYVFDRIVRANIGLFRTAGVKRIITFCPHCYNSFKNDYPAYGADFEVFHHTEMISPILAAMGPLPGAPEARVVIHDSCYLGRYNAIYEEPRQIIESACGSQAIDMDRTRGESFCCGAGGGRLWMHESRGERISSERTRQALAKEPSIIATSCPYCLMMFEDGLKDEGSQGPVRAMDVSELAMEAIVRGRKQAVR